MTTICSISSAGIDQSLVDAVTEDEALYLINDIPYNSYTPYYVTLMRPDVLLFDMDGIAEKKVLETIYTTKHTNPDMKIIVLTSVKEEALLLQLLEMEMDSLLQKPAKSINKAIHAVLANHFIIPDSIKQALVSRVISMKETNMELFTVHVMNDFALTDSESKVAYELRRGLKNQEIAEKLQMTNGSVKVLVSRIYKKTGCKTREEVGDVLIRRQVI